MPISDPIPASGGPDTMTSRIVRHDHHLGQNVCTEIWKSFSGAYTPTVELFWDYITEEVEGEFTTTFTYKVGDEREWNYKVRSALSTAPLITAPCFCEGGDYVLTQDDKNKIAEAESDPHLWATYQSTHDPTTPLGKYIEKIQKGETEVLVPSIIASLVRIEDSQAYKNDMGRICNLASCSLPDDYAASNYNWLMCGADGDCINQNDGSPVFRNVYEFRLSGYLGWDEDEYPEGGTYP